MLPLMTSEQSELQTQSLRYRFLAYTVLRDALGFYFGIQKFFKTQDMDEAYMFLLSRRIQKKEDTLQRSLTERETERQRVLTKAFIAKRVAELEEDLTHSQDVLFSSNIWLDLLNLDPEFFKSYLPTLTESEVELLSVVPTWLTPDHDLGRRYMQDVRDIKSISFNV